MAATISSASPPPARAAIRRRSATPRRRCDERSDIFGYERVTPDEKTRRVRGVFDSVAGKLRPDERPDVGRPASAAGSASPSTSRGVRAGRARARPRRRHRRPRAAVRRSARGRRAPSSTPTSTARCSPPGRDRLHRRGVVLPTVAVQRRGAAVPGAHVRLRVDRLRPAQRHATRSARSPRCARVLRPGGVGAGARVLARRGAAGAARTTGTASTCCRASAGSSPTTRRATATSPNRSACIRTRQTLKTLMERAGFDRVDYYNLAAGVVALHAGRVY